METEELMQQVLSLQEQLEEKDQTIVGLENKITSFDEERTAFEAEKSKLKEANMALFLKVSQPIETVAAVEEKTVVSWDEIASKI